MGVWFGVEVGGVVVVGVGVVSMWFGVEVGVVVVFVFDVFVFVGGVGGVVVVGCGVVSDAV